jgi:xanthine dehydrogenase small subunit
LPAEPPVETPVNLADAYALLALAQWSADAEAAAEALTADSQGAPIGTAGGPASGSATQLTPIAGGTDVMVRITGEIGEPPVRLLDLWRLDELRGISSDGEAITLGALTTYTDIRQSAACREHLPALVESAATIGAAQIQNRGTLGGNIANASPAGDTLPVLLALDAEIVVGGPRGERTIPAAEFWVAYRRTALAPDELVLRIRIPVAGGREARFRKIGTRRAQAISKVVMALAWREGGGQRSGRAWSDVRLALGSVADRPIRATATEAVLEGSMPTPETADAAAAAIAAEITPIDDVRSTADYRRAVAARVLHRLIREAGGW